MEVQVSTICIRGFVAGGGDRLDSGDGDDEVSEDEGVVDDVEGIEERGEMMENRSFEQYDGDDEGSSGHGEDAWDEGEECCAPEELEHDGASGRSYGVSGYFSFRMSSLIWDRARRNNGPS